jgi:hypothetical protein
MRSSRSFLWSSLGLVLLLAGPHSALAQSSMNGHSSPTPRRAHTVQPSETPIRVDGLLDEPAWRQAQVVEIPFEWMPGENIPAPVRTEARVSYDRDYLYVSFRAFDPDPSRIRAQLRDRDSGIVLDDNVGFMIDTFHDRRRAFEFMVNPLGVQMDAVFNEQTGQEDFSWDAIWHAIGRITEDGFIVEIAIPFTSLRFPRTDDAQTWGIYFFRNWPREDYHRMRSVAIGRDVSGLLRHIGEIDGFQGITPGHNLELDPTLSSIRTDARSGGYTGRMASGDLETEPGLTMKWGVTPNLVLNATLNPDFSQVEADVAQLDVNTRFSLFYPERRPFFLEGSDYFSIPMNAVVTRSVADPTAGVKLTGKEGRHSIGIYMTRDRVNNLIFPSNQGNQAASFDQEVTTAVLRHRYDLGDNSSLGLLYTGRFADGYRNQVGGIDAFLRLSDTKTIGVQALRSLTAYPDSAAAAWGQPTGTFSSYGMVAYFSHASRDWAADLSFIDKGRDLRADAGFITQVDVKGVSTTLLRQFWGKPGGWYNHLMVGLGTFQFFDQQNVRTDADVSLFLIYEGPRQSMGSLRLGYMNTRYLGVVYDQPIAILEFGIRPSRPLSIGMNATFSRDIDYAHARPADQIVLGPSAILSMGRHWRIDLNHSHQRLDVTGGRLFTMDLTQARLVYNFSVRAYARLVLQHRQLDRNTAQYAYEVDPLSRGLFSQFLFSYKLNPQTVLFLGYSDNYTGGDFAGLTRRVDLTQTDRTVFMKLGYALVF